MEILPESSTDLLPPAPAPPSAPEVSSTETSTVVRGSVQQGWFSANLRNLIALSITIAVGYLVLTGDRDARIAVIAAFSILMGAIWGERAALKQPGRDS